MTKISLFETGCRVQQYHIIISDNQLNVSLQYNNKLFLSRFFFITMTSSILMVIIRIHYSKIVLFIDLIINKTVGKEI